MPLYDFKCNACGERFEIMSSSSEREDKAVCPEPAAAGTWRRCSASFAVGGHKGQFNPGTFVKPGKGMMPVHRP